MDPDLSASWWAERAKRLLHPIQVEIVEVFQRRDQPLTLRDLSEVFGDTKLWKLKHHMRRLRHLGALEVAGGKSGVGFMDVPYRLVKEPSRSADRAPLATHFGIHLATRRKHAGLSQEQLGVRASLPEDKIRSLELGECEPSLGEVAKLAPGLSTSINDLLDGIESEPEGRSGGRFEPPDVGDESAN